MNKVVYVFWVWGNQCLEHDIEGFVRKGSKFVINYLRWRREKVWIMKWTKKEGIIISNLELSQTWDLYSYAEEYYNAFKMFEVVYVYDENNVAERH
jgi:hypothetical protein